MKKENWQKIYAPKGDELDIRVRNTLRSLDQGKARAFRRTWSVAMAAVLVFAAAAALAAGIVLSARVDMEAQAMRVLEKEYGLTAEMETFFRCLAYEDEQRVALEPFDAGIIDDRLGIYTVQFGNGKAKASWSFDGEEIGDDLSSPIWNTALLAKAMERKAQGEEWYEILLPQERLAVNISEEQAIQSAREEIERRYGAAALEGCELMDAHLYVDVSSSDMDGHGVRRYMVMYGKPEQETEMLYTARLYADDGGIIDCFCEREVPFEAPDSQMEEEWERAEQERLAQMSAQTEEELIAAASSVIAQRYGLTEEQLTRMELTDSAFDMMENTLIYTARFWLWTRSDGEWTQGDGMYTVSIDANTGVIEYVEYDSTLSGNG